MGTNYNYFPFNMMLKLEVRQKLVTNYEYTNTYVILGKKR